jgi:hypothetical protein
MHEAAAGEIASAETTTQANRPSRPHHRPVAPTMEEKVRLLSRNLGLDPSQQARLRELLESERRELRNLWISRPNVTDRVGPTLDILERTKDQIRAMLTEEQSRKYPAPVRREALAPAQADPEYWMQLTQPRGGAGGEAAN